MHKASWCIAVFLIGTTTGGGCNMKKEEKPAAPAPATPAPAPEPVKSSITVDKAPHSLIAAGSNKCVQVSSTAEGAEVQIASCNASAAQTFVIEPAAGGGGQYTIRNPQADKCLDVEGVSQDDGASIKTFGCNGGPNQQWALADAAAGTIRLVASHSGKVADVWGEATADGTPLKQFPWKSSAQPAVR